MKLLSSIRPDSLIMPIFFFFFFYDPPIATGSNSGHGRKTPVCASSKYEVSPCISDQYRSLDAPVQIAGCTSTDRRMRNFRAGNAAGSDREVVEKNEKYRQYQRIELD